MKIIIAGTRHMRFTPEAITTALSYAYDTWGWRTREVTMIVSGGCRGPDLDGEAWAILHNIPVRRFPADWEKNGRAAGPMRNIEMAAFGDGLIVRWDGVSSGTRHMMECMQALNKPIYKASV